MIPSISQELQGRAQRATKALAEARTQISDSFNQDYVVGSSAIETLISAQHSVHHWTLVARIVGGSEDEATTVQRLGEWVSHTMERLVGGGRGSSTSLVQNAITLSEEEELRRVLQSVRGCLTHLSA